MRFLQQVGPCLGGFVTNTSPHGCHAGYGPPSNGTHFLTPTQSSGRPPELFLYLQPSWWVIGGSLVLSKISAAYALTKMTLVI